MASSVELTRHSLERRAWLVPFAVTLALILGLVLSSLISPAVDPSGVIQSTLSTPIPNQLDAGVVILLFGTPFAALGAAIITYASLSRPRAWPYAALGVVGGVLIFSGITASCLGIGDWWISQVPTDTNRAAALLTAILAPPGTLALLLASTSARVARSPQWGGPLLRFLWLGAQFGAVLGGLIGGSTAVITWSISCPQNSYTNCFSVSGVLGGGLLIGGIEGAALGAVCGYAAWTMRFRGPAQAITASVGEGQGPG